MFNSNIVKTILLNMIRPITSYVSFRSNFLYKKKQILNPKSRVFAFKTYYWSSELIFGNSRRRYNAARRSTEAFFYKRM